MKSQPSERWKFWCNCIGKPSTIYSYTLEIWPISVVNQFKQGIANPCRKTMSRVCHTCIVLNCGSICWFSVKENNPCRKFSVVNFISTLSNYDGTGKAIMIFPFNTKFNWIACFSVHGCLNCQLAPKGNDFIYPFFVGG